MKYGYHYTPCDSACSGPGLWLLVKLAAALGTAAGVWWLLKAIGRGVASAADTVSVAAGSAAPVVLILAVVVLASPLALFALLVVRNNQRPPMLPHDRPDPLDRPDRRLALEGSTVEVIDVTPNPRPLSAPRPAYQPAFATSARPKAAVTGSPL
jgi:hypothetical protein